jgi:hypothetical protein
VGCASGLLSTSNPSSRWDGSPAAAGGRARGFEGVSASRSFGRLMALLCRDDADSRGDVHGRPLLAAERGLPPAAHDG